MEILIWAGAVVTMGGVVALLACIVYIVRVRRAGLGDAALRQALHKGAIWNMAALFGSVLGLMMVVVGIVLS